MENGTEGEALIYDKPVQRRARIVGELPPLPRARSINGDHHNNEDDGDDDEKAAEISDKDEESDFDEPVKTEGGLSAKIAARLDERQFEDDRRLAQGVPEVLEDDDSDALADYPFDTEELEVTHARLRSLDKLRLNRFAATVKRLSLRQNLLSSLRVEDGSTPLSNYALLEDLDLYDNRLSAVVGLQNMRNLKSLDLSFNLLRKIPAKQLQNMASLSVLYLIQNKISMIDGLMPLASTLTSIELGGNKLRKIENLEACVNLTELWLGKNKITKLEGMSTLRKLKIISIQSNRILKLEGLDDLESLEEVYVSHNGIKKLEGLDHNHKLRVLDIGNNYIPDIENIAHLSHLEEFWASNNTLTNITQLDGQLSQMQNLETVYLEGNPLEQMLGGNYRRKIMAALPQIVQIDATYVQR